MKNTYLILLSRGSSSLLFGSLFVLPFSSCSHRADSNLHKKNERVVNVRAFGASPLVGDALLWRGGGDIPNYGIGVEGYKFVTDRLALGAGLTVRNYNDSGSDARAVEIEGRMRYYVAETEKAGLFLDLNGGGMWAQDPIPERGSEWNYTFAFGPGIEVPLSKNKSLLFGAEFHHLSNADGSYSRRNPSQNEILYWVSHSWKW